MPDNISNTLYSVQVLEYAELRLELMEIYYRTVQMLDCFFINMGSNL